MTHRLVPIPGIQSFTQSVTKERRLQLSKWGDQKYPNGTGVNVTDRYVRDDAIHQTQDAAASGTLTWRLILAEEVAQAFAESDLDALEYELVQAAAVVQAWLADITRQREAVK